MKDRSFVKSLFFAHANKTRITDIRATGEPYQFSCRLNWTPQTACLLVKSSDYWEKRLHMVTHSITLFVVWSHDSCVPYPVLCLEDGKEYLAYTCAVDTSRRTRRTASAFLGQLLCGVQSAFDTLQVMPYQSRRRYERQLEALAHRRAKGRPLKLHKQGEQAATG